MKTDIIRMKTDTPPYTIFCAFDSPFRVSLTKYGVRAGRAGDHRRIRGGVELPDPLTVAAL